MTAPAKTVDIDNLCVNTIRTLSMDAVQAANSGHPGTPMAMAPVAYTIWNRKMHFNPENPVWFNRDRFVLSMGHASMLLYSMLHLTGVKAVNSAYEAGGTATVSLEDIKRFRQLDSKCPGHPEYHWTSGVETTTGPLGQGFATSVGMAMAQKWMASYFNKPGFEIVQLPHFRARRRRLHDGRRSPAKQPPSPAISSSATSAGSTTTITSPSKATRPGLQRRRRDALHRLRLERRPRRRCERSGTLAECLERR